MADECRSESGHTIDTLKESFEQQLRAACQKFELKFHAMEEKFSSRDKATGIQNEANIVHFQALNHENERIAKAAETSVSRDTWDEFLKNHQNKISEIDRILVGLLPRSEFQTYKDTTNTALTMSAGQSQGVGLTAGIVVQIITCIGALATLVGVLVILFGKH